jgi:transcriptional regulator with GAF, ATPase, and Fis domain
MTNTSLPSSPLLVGKSPIVERLRHEIDSAARADAAVLIEGETGVGKDVAARLITSQGRRRAQRFVAVNCAGLPDSLLESELFGHVRGSFTGAYRDKPGLAAMADGGTLFLDEVGEMSPRMQAVLLRFAESGEIHPVGSDRSARVVDVRLIAATNRPLANLVTAAEFRGDLYYRLNVIHVIVPPLRDRDSDIILLLNQFLSDFARAHQARVPVFTDGAAASLLRYGWPGNIRELKNFAEQMVVRFIDRPIDWTDLPAHLVSSQTATSPDSVSVPSARSAADRAWEQMVRDGITFWAAVYDVFMDRELTKTDVRQIVRRGLQQTQGSYRRLTELFHMTPREYRRFLAFLHQQGCHIAVGPTYSPPAHNESLGKVREG